MSPKISNQDGRPPSSWDGAIPNSFAILFSGENVTFLRDYDVIIRGFPQKSGIPHDFVTISCRHPNLKLRYLFCRKLHLNIDSTPLTPPPYPTPFPHPLPSPPSPILLAPTPLPLSTTHSPNNLPPCEK